MGTWAELNLIRCGTGETEDLVSKMWFAVDFVFVGGRLGVGVRLEAGG